MSILSLSFSLPLSVITAAVMSAVGVLGAPDRAGQNEMPSVRTEGSVSSQLPEVSARGCVLIDALSGDIIFGQNERERLPMASTTKIMSAYLALMQDGLDEPFTVDSDAIRVEGSSMGLTENDTVTLRTLVYGMLLPSGNDAAGAAAVRISGTVQNFVQLMNDCADELALEDTHFVTPSGLDDDTDEHYSTALDMARLTRQAMRLDAFREICSSKTAQVEFGAPPYKRWLTNTNRLLGMCEGCIGVKTGFTDKAGRCLVSACKRGGAELICVTLNDKDDWADHAKLYDYGFSQLTRTPLTPELSGYKIPCAEEGRSVTAVGGEDELLLPESARKRIERVTLIKPFLYSAEKNEKVGETRFYLDGEEVGRLDIVVQG